MNQEQVITKVRKLIALGENAGATEAERERAITQAHKFLAKYNLDIAAINDETEDDRINVIKQFTNTPANRRVAMAISELYFVKHLFFKGTNKHVFVGTPVNVEVALNMTQWVIRGMNSEAYHLSITQGDVPNSTFRTSFLHGASDAIVDKAREIIEANRTQSPSVPGTSLVLADIYRTEMEKNDEYVKQEFGESRQHKARTRKVDVRAYTQGVEYGSRVNLNHQIK